MAALFCDAAALFCAADPRRSETGLFIETSPRRRASSERADMGGGVSMRASREAAEASMVRDMSPVLAAAASEARVDRREFVTVAVVDEVDELFKREEDERFTTVAILICTAEEESRRE